MKLAKKLSEWEQIKLIDEKQKSAILAYESRQGKNRLPFILSALAVFCIGLGILSLIASNWQEIPDSLKLSADILLLGLIVFTTEVNGILRRLSSAMRH